MPFSIIVIFLGFFLSCAPAVFSEELEPLRSSLPLPASISSPPSVTVAILRSENQIKLGTPFPYQAAGISQPVTTQGNALPESVAKINHSGIQIGTSLFPCAHLKLSTSNEGYFSVNGRHYWGNIHLIKEASGKLLVINEVGLEEYVKGVLPSEVNSQWPPEVLKAQAVVARTFALFKSLEKADKLYALEANVISQVYRGKSAEKASTNQAVDLTKGEILSLGDTIFPAFFHACCGGQTAQADDVFQIQPNPVLQSIHCPFCAESKYYRWQAKVSFRDIESKIRAHGFTISPIVDVSFEDYDLSGRAKTVLIRHQKGVLNLAASDFRLFVGPDVIRSTKAKVISKKNEALFHGFGWGHGIGFCQWGGKKQAELGKTCDQILTFYYPGSTKKKLYGSSSISGKLLEWIGW